ncbi:hypothetical protein ZIOFF_058233 [Zingiber officinale]|uniref:Uncharacterized protein n=1 Tax=Zingiber officinale TaxID=94328 RepID=A0A8J5FER7_ZINOF|nr:hypothetical protein ZIOFF_058233 [Zingiber officinale]
MVCIACLLPLFLIPVVNALPLLFDLIVGKIYRLFGWEYRKPARVPAACPYKPASKNVDGLNAGSCTQVAFEQTTGLVAVSTEDYCVQFYSLFDNHEVSEVQVCKRNFQPADDVMLYVALVAISLDGSLMATIDVTIPEEKLGAVSCSHDESQFAVLALLSSAGDADAKGNGLKKMALRVIVESLSEEEIAGLKEAIPCDGHQQQRLVNDEVL